ncbi:hypothetical protein Sros01_74630 [Streptomyces roseochromogenus]|nr:hypothetical protein Sros01_74630 [Streptomyces roseochromogenus]
MENTDPRFAELAGEFGQALDDWSQEVRTALGDKNRNQIWLATKLGVRQERVSGWMQGRKQLSGGAALPGAATTKAIVEKLELEGAAASRLTGRGDHIDYLQRQLMSGRRDWRKQTSDYLFGSPAPAEAEAANTVESATPPAPSTETTDQRDQASTDTRRLRPVQDRWARLPKIAKVAVVAVPLTLLAGLTAAATRSGHDDRHGAPDAALPAGSAPPALATPAVAASDRPAQSERPGLEKGTLGEDSRCSAPNAGPEGLVWRVCARVEAGRISFALKVTNAGQQPSTVKVRLQYTQSNATHPCPGLPSTQALTVPAGRTILTDSGQCAVPRLNTPAAYQAGGWVLPADATDGSYKLAPAAHVYPDRIIWQPDLV